MKDCRLCRFVLKFEEFLSGEMIKSVILNSRQSLKFSFLKVDRFEGEICIQNISIRNSFVQI